jgi:hypothetical protein
MILYNKRYSINNGIGHILFSEGADETVNATYEMGKNQEIGTVHGKLDGLVLKGVFHNKANNVSGNIEFAFSEGLFQAKWKQGFEVGPMRGKWIGVADDFTGEKSTLETRSVGIYAGFFDDEDELYQDYGANQKPAIIAIGFFETHLEDTDEEWYGFVGYIVTNTIDKFRTESVLFMNRSGDIQSAHDMGGEAICEDNFDLVEYFNELYPNEWNRIHELLWEYFELREEDEDTDSIHLTSAKAIPEEIQLSTLYPDNSIDLEEVSLHNGVSVGLVLNT